ncbi:hypothetical protein D3C87_1730770 [compost metagenome]
MDLITELAGAATRARAFLAVAFFFAGAAKLAEVPNTSNKQQRSLIKVRLRTSPKALSF